MTASIVVEASSSPRCLGEKKEAQKQKKKKSTTFPAAGTRRKRVAKKKEDNQDEDFDDLMCEEEPLIGKRRRKGTGKASNTTRSRSGTISKISSLFFFVSVFSCVFCFCFSLFLNSKIFKIVGV
jgi:hypothetical protein